MTTLHDLQRALFPTARPIGSPELTAERGQREVGWVRVLKPRVPAFEALETGDLAIIPGPALAVVAPGQGQVHDLIVALVRAQVPAVLLVEGDTGDDALDALGEAASTAGLTALHLGRADPAGLERSVIGFLVNRRAELDRRAADLEAQLARFALLGRGLDVQAATIGAFLGRAVVIEGRRGDPIAVHAPADLPTAAAAVARYLARPTGAGALRIDIPAAAGEPGPTGRLILLGDEPPNELERIAAERVAALLALELARDEAVRQAREETRRGDPLPADGPPWVVMLASQGTSIGPDDIAAREETRAELRLLMSPRRLVLRGSSESLELRLVAAAPSDDPDGLATAERLAMFLGRTVADQPSVQRAWRPTCGRGGGTRHARSGRHPARSATRRPSIAPSRVPAAGQRAEPARRGASGARAARADPRRTPECPAGKDRHPRGRPVVAQPGRGGRPAGRPPQHDRLPGATPRTARGLGPGRP